MPTSFGSKGFPTTLWSVVQKAGVSDAGQVADALTHLCRVYWYPLYSFVRRRGHSPHDAQDLTQAFFAHLLEKRAFEHANRQRGRFRTFLLASLKNFLANEWDRSQALKRGGGQKVVSLDQDSAESRFQLEPSHDLSPDRHFERTWALTLIEQALADLQEEFTEDGKGDLFDALKPALTGQPVSYPEMAERLGRTEGAIKVAVHRLRRRFRDLMRERIAQTVGEDEVEDELRHLLDVLGG